MGAWMLRPGHRVESDQMSKSKQNQPRAGKDNAAGKAASAKADTPRAASASRREQLRVQQEAESRRRRTIGIITAAAVVLAVVIIVVVVVVIVQNRGSSGGQSTPGSTADQIVPPSANADNTGLVYNRADPAAGAPEVVVYMDYQCPGCGQASKLVEPGLEELADNGEILLTYQILHGLYRNFPGDHSFRAATAATCADVQGVFPKYSKLVFAGQPATEGDGWTDQQLGTDYPKLAGLDGDALSAFQTCFTDQATADFVNSMQDALPSYVTSTPFFTVNGDQWSPTTADLASTDAMRQAIQQLAG